jgi:hypothetical protein
MKNTSLLLRAMAVVCLYIAYSTPTSLRHKHMQMCTAAVLCCSADQLLTNHTIQSSTALQAAACQPAKSQQTNQTGLIVSLQKVYRSMQHS